MSGSGRRIGCEPRPGPVDNCGPVASPAPTLDGVDQTEWGPGFVPARDADTAPEDEYRRRPRAEVAVLGLLEKVVRRHVAIGVEPATALVAVQLGRRPGDPVAMKMIDEAHRLFMDDPAAPVAMLASGVLVHAPTLYAGAVFTHRASAGELVDGYLEVDTDLAGFLRCHPPRVASGPVYVEDADDGPVTWNGPYGWLDNLPLDALLGVRATEDGEVAISVLGSEPAASPACVELLRVVYDAEVAQTGLPVTAENLALGMLCSERTAFARPRLPLIELAAAAGLDRRGPVFAHDPQVWERAADRDRQARLTRRLGPGPRSAAAVQALAMLAGPAPEGLRHALDLLMDPDVLRAVADELLAGTDAGRELAVLACRLVTVAGRSPGAAAARWLAAVAAERDSRVLDADAHLRAGIRYGRGWEPIEDRLAWYDSDRGDAAAAAERWEAIGTPTDTPDLRAVRPFVRAPSPARCRTGRAGSPTRLRPTCAAAAGRSSSQILRRRSAETIGSPRTSCCTRVAGSPGSSPTGRRCCRWTRRSSAQHGPPSNAPSSTSSRPDRVARRPSATCAPTSTST